MVTSLNEDNESVTVEWIENGDTKGKEVKHHVLLLKAQLAIVCFYLVMNNTFKGIQKITESACVDDSPTRSHHLCTDSGHVSHTVYCNSISHCSAMQPEWSFFSVIY